MKHICVAPPEGDMEKGTEEPAPAMLGFTVH